MVNPNLRDDGEPRRLQIHGSYIDRYGNRCSNQVDIEQSTSYLTSRRDENGNALTEPLLTVRLHTHTHEECGELAGLILKLVADYADSKGWGFDRENVERYVETEVYGGYTQKGLSLETILKGE